jgi:hypothetical protein
MDNKIKKYLESKEGKSIKTLIAYTIRKTPTQADDEILKDVDKVSEAVTASINSIAEAYPTNQEATNAVILLLEKVAKEVNKKWLITIVKLIKRFFYKK